MRYLIIVLLIFTCCKIPGTGTGQNVDPVPDLQIEYDFKILFVGNSLTYFNNLPKLLQEFGEDRNVLINTQSLAYANYALEDHWNDGYVQQQIELGNFDYVIIQQGPSSQQYGKESLIEYGEKFKLICDQYGSQLAFFMVWPSMTYYNTFSGVIENYTNAAEQNEALLCPVGERWKKHFDATGDFSFYGPDGFHPSQKGSEYAAEIIFESLFERED